MNGTLKSIPRSARRPPPPIKAQQVLGSGPITISESFQTKSFLESKTLEVDGSDYQPCCHKEKNNTGWTAHSYCRRLADAICDSPGHMGAFHIAKAARKDRPCSMYPSCCAQMNQPVLSLFSLISKLPAWIYNRDSRPSQSRVSADRVAPRNAAVNKAKRRICYVESSLASERDIRLLEIQPSTKGSTIHDDRKNRLPRRRSRFGGAFLYMGKLWEKLWHLLQQTRIFVNVNLKRLCNRSESPQRILTLWIDAICID